MLKQDSLDFSKKLTELDQKLQDLDKELIEARIELVNLFWHFMEIKENNQESKTK